MSLTFYATRILDHPTTVTTHHRTIPNSASVIEIKQRRSQVTYEAFIQTGFRLFKHGDLDDISIADLSRQAGYSVGAFYSRFRSKDDFMDVLIGKHLENRALALDKIFNTESLETLIPTMIEDIFQYYYEHRSFWRAVLKRKLSEASYWQVYKQHGEAIKEKMLNRIQLDLKRPLTREEGTKLGFASQMMHGWINNMTLNPLFETNYPDQAQNLAHLTRAYMEISGFDKILDELTF